MDRQDQIYKKAYVCIGLLVINVIVYILNDLSHNFLMYQGSLITQSVIADGEYHRLFTSMFLHFDVEHIGSNMLMLMIAGSVVENYAGHVYFLIMYLLCGVGADVLSMTLELKRGNVWMSAGASGAITGIVGFIVIWIILHRDRFLANGAYSYRLLLLGVYIVYSCFFQTGANTYAHLGGFLMGVLMGAIDILILRNDKTMEGIV